jgi:hypothetical protein
LSLTNRLFTMAMAMALAFLLGCTPAGGEPIVPQTFNLPIPLSTTPTVQGRIVVAETFTGEW